MDFSFSEEQEQIRSVARDVLARNPSAAELAEQGWVGLSASASFLEAAVVFEEVGRALYEGPYVGQEVGDDRTRLLVAYALEAVGIGARVVELSVAYAAQREQFGKKIGSYQAVSHPIVDAYVDVELARSLAYWAAWCVDTGDAQTEVAAAAANAHATEAAVRACETAIQVHGGIGFTWEHPLHRYYKRALWLESALGFPREQRAEIAAFLLSS